MRYYVYFSDGGMPAGGLSPQWWCLKEGTPVGIDLTDTANIDNGISEVARDTEVSGGCGWYYYDITFGQGVWSTTTVDLVGIIDGGGELSTSDRYKEVKFLVRDLSSAIRGHKGIQNKTTGNIDIYKVDGTTKELKLEMTDDGTNITRDPTSAT